MLSVNNLIGFGAGRKFFSANFVTAQNSVPGGSTTTHTFTGIDVGPANPGRITVVGVASRTAISGVTLNGNAMTEATESANVSLTTAIYYLANPTGDTANVVVTLGANNSWCEAAVFRVLYADQSTPRLATSGTESNDTTGSSVAPGGSTFAGYAQMIMAASLAISPPIGSVSLSGIPGVYSNASQTGTNDVTTVAGFEISPANATTGTLNYNAANRGAISVVTFR